MSETPFKLEILTPVLFLQMDRNQQCARRSKTTVWNLEFDKYKWLLMAIWTHSAMFSVRPTAGITARNAIKPEGQLRAQVRRAGGEKLQFPFHFPSRLDSTGWGQKQDWQEIASLSYSSKSNLQHCPAQISWKIPFPTLEYYANWVHEILSNSITRLCTYRRPFSEMRCTSCLRKTDLREKFLEHAFAKIPPPDVV